MDAFLRTMGIVEALLFSPWIGLIWFVHVLVLAGWIIRQRREPAATLAWLLALAWLPVLGLAVYWWLGPQRLGRRNLKRLRARLPSYGAPSKDYRERPVIVGGSDSPQAIAPDDVESNDALRWLNASVEGVMPGEPLQAELPFTLVIGVDVDKRADVVAADPFEASFPDGLAELELTVVLDCDECDVHIENQTIRVPRSGRSVVDARFVLMARENGTCNVRALVFFGAQFVQKLKITLAIGKAAKKIDHLEVSGRPLNEAARLQRRDIALYIEPAHGDGFSLVVTGAVHARASLPIKQAQLAAAIAAARNSIMKVVTKKIGTTFPFQANTTVDKSLRDEALQILAQAGHSLFLEIFFGPGTDAQAHRVGDWLIEQASRDPGLLKIQIIARDFPVPWALLYLTDSFDPDAIDWRRFLGMRHIIEQIPAQMNLSTPDERIGVADVPLPVSLSFNASIDDQMGARHVSRQRNYWANAHTSTGRKLVCTQRDRKSEFLGALRSPSMCDEIIYMFCHAETVSISNPAGLGASWLALTDNQRVTLQELRLCAPETQPLRSNPLVFINACESAELSPESCDGFVPYFISKGARGVIGTECKAPAVFAADWSMAFFDEFLRGRPLGDVVLSLRQYFLQEHNNPLGLMYAIHCNGDTVVVQATN